MLMDVAVSPRNHGDCVTFNPGCADNRASASSQGDGWSQNDSRLILLKG